MGLNKMETDISNYQVSFEYLRIPNHYCYSVPNKGKPKSGHLYRYKRGIGFSKNGFYNYRPLSKGGQVICSIGNENGRSAFGIANCSYSDNFCYKIGREIALGRAKKQLKEKETK